MDNVNTMPMTITDDPKDWHPKLKPLPDEAKLGSLVPDAMKLSAMKSLAYTYGPRHYGVLDYKTQPVTALKAELDPTVKEIPAQTLTNKTVTSSSYVDSLVEKMMPSLPLFEDASKTTSITPTDVWRTEKILEGRSPAQKVFLGKGSQGISRPYHCDQPAGPKPIYYTKVVP